MFVIAVKAGTVSVLVESSYRYVAVTLAMTLLMAARLISCRDRPASLGLAGSRSY